jgi:hypothetical protein
MKWIGKQTIYDKVRFSNDVEFYQPINDADPSVSIGSSDAERLRIKVLYTGTTSQTAQIASFTTYTESATANDGRFHFSVDETQILRIQDDGLDLRNSSGISIDGTTILSDSSGTATLSNIDALDATTISTISSAISAGDITGVTLAGDSGSASDTSGNVDLTIAGGTNATTSATGTTVTINVDDAFLKNNADDATTGTITSTGLIVDGDKNVTPGNGAMLHIDTSEITDNNTSASGTAAQYNHVKFEGPTLTASNASVTTTDAAVLRLGTATAGTNQTITNNLSLVAEGPSSLRGVTNTSNYAQTSGDMTLYHAANDANPTISLGSSATERLEIKAEYESGAQGLDVVKFITHTAGSAANDARYAFQVDETFILNIKDNGLQLKASGEFEIGSGNTILSDSSGTTTLSNIDALDATTEDTIETAIDTLSNLTEVGTIGTGVWQGTAIATDQQKHLAWFVLRGYGTGDGTNYEIPEIISDTNAPFEHNTSAGSDGLTAQTVQTMMRLGGVVAPRAGTLKKWYGWATTSGSQAANIGLFRVRPTRNDNSNLTPVLLDNVSYTALGNTKMEDFDETTFTDADIAAGDIIYTGIKCQSSKTTYFTSTLEIEWD